MSCLRSSKVFGLVILAGLLGGGCAVIPEPTCKETRVIKAPLQIGPVVFLPKIKQEVDCYEETTYTIRYTNDDND